MSDFGDYLSVMDKYRTSDEQIEGLFAGTPSPGDDLDAVADLFAALRSNFEEFDDEVVGRMVATSVAAVSSAETAATPVASERKRQFTLGALRRRAATVTVAATVFLGGTSGLAVAANGAMPGDTLYGIDRALEAVGIGAGGEQERLVEAEALIETGQVVRGLEHAAEALDDSGSASSNASQALIEAAERVRAAGAEPSAMTREGVADLLTYLAENTGKVDGRQVAELAVQIGQPDGHTPPGQADPGEQPGNSPADPPGRVENEPGPPDSKPADPPGQNKDKKEPGPPDHVPADPPGQNKDK